MDKSPILAIAGILLDTIHIGSPCTTQERWSKITPTDLKSRSTPINGLFNQRTVSPAAAPPPSIICAKPLYGLLADCSACVRLPVTAWNSQTFLAKRKELGRSSYNRSQSTVFDSGLLVACHDNVYGLGLRKLLTEFALFWWLCTDWGHIFRLLIIPISVPPRVRVSVG